MEHHNLSSLEIRLKSIKKELDAVSIRYKCSLKELNFKKQLIAKIKTEKQLLGVQIYRARDSSDVQLRKKSFSKDNGFEVEFDDINSRLLSGQNIRSIGTQVQEKEYFEKGSKQKATQNKQGREPQINDMSSKIEKLLLDPQRRQLRERIKSLENQRGQIFDTLQNYLSVEEPYISEKVLQRIQTYSKFLAKKKLHKLLEGKILRYQGSWIGDETDKKGMSLEKKQNERRCGENIEKMKEIMKRKIHINDFIFENMTSEEVGELGAGKGVSVITCKKKQQILNAYSNVVQMIKEQEIKRALLLDEDDQVTVDLKGFKSAMDSIERCLNEREKVETRWDFISKEKQLRQRAEELQGQMRRISQSG